jgi:hypothetical protein
MWLCDENSRIPCQHSLVAAAVCGSASAQLLLILLLLLLLLLLLALLDSHLHPLLLSPPPLLPPSQDHDWCLHEFNYFFPPPSAVSGLSYSLSRLVYSVRILHIVCLKGPAEYYQIPSKLHSTTGHSRLSLGLQIILLLILIDSGFKHCFNR